MIRLFAFLVLFAVLVAQAQGQEAEPPIKQQNLTNALQVGGLSDQKFADIVKKRGLAFEMTMADEEAFRKAGAGELLIEALWWYDAFKVQPAPPVAREEVVILLRNGTPSRRVERIVRERKAAMVVDKATRDEIVKAGGSGRLMGVIGDNLVEETRKEDTPPAVVPTAKQPTPEKSYDALISDAEKAEKAGQYSQATDILVEAKKVDPSRAKAFELDGYIWLYLLHSVPRGGEDYSAAIEKGGEVALRVRYQHGKLKGKSYYGWLHIGKTVVHFDPDDKDQEHTFRFTRKQIVDLDTDRRLKEGGFHIKIDNGSPKAEPLKFHSAHSENKAEEEQMIVALLR